MRALPVAHPASATPDLTPLPPVGAAVARRTALLSLAALASLGSAGRAQAQGIAAARPEEVGLSPQRLAGLGEWIRAEIAQKKIPGAVTMIVRGGKVAWLDVAGQRTPDGPAMKVDDIFRIYSMTKPIVSVAALMLVEEGRLFLEFPVARYIPAFADVKVGIEKTDAGGQKTLELVAPRRPMTVHDLLRHTSGLTYGFFGEGLVKKAYVDNGIDASSGLTNAEFADRIARMPLAYHPGSTWDYSNSTDVLGRVIEVASGQTLFDHLKARLFDPLGMRDTSFYVTDAARQARIAEPFADDRAFGAGTSFNDPRVAQKRESGGGGLVSTAPDYARFLMMLRNGGQLDGRRYLSPRTLEFMTANHLADSVVRTPLYLPGIGYGFGLGVAVRTSTGEAPSASALGEYYWGGAGGTYMWVDPASDLFVVFMMQSPKNRVPYRAILRNRIYGAMTEARVAAR